MPFGVQTMCSNNKLSKTEENFCTVCAAEEYVWQTYGEFDCHLDTQARPAVCGRNFGL